MKHPPLMQDSVPAGFPSPAQDYVENALDLNELCIKHPAATYFVRATGESMLDVGIFPNDILIVDRALTPRSGDVVIAAIDGEFTVKELCLDPRPLLRARSDGHADVEIGELSELELFGVVSYVIHALR